MELLTDESLMKQVKSGQLSACGLLYKRYHRILFSYFLNNTGDRSKSEDLVQTTFEKILKYKHNYGEQIKFKPWIFSIAKNAFIDEYNKKKKNAVADLSNFENVHSHEDTYEKQMIKDERTAQLYRALNLLDHEKREFLSMVKLNEMKYQDVAKLYNMTESNVKVRVFRIMKELKKKASRLDFN